MAGWPKSLLVLLLPVSFAQQVANCRIGAGQCFFVRQEHDAEMLGAGALTEAGAVYYHDVFLADQFGDEDVVPLGDVDRRIRVERSAGRDTAYAGSLRRTTSGEIAP